MPSILAHPRAARVCMRARWGEKEIAAYLVFYAYAVWAR